MRSLNDLMPPQVLQERYLAGEQIPTYLELLASLEQQVLSDSDPQLPNELTTLRAGLRQRSRNAQILLAAVPQGLTCWP